MSAEKNDLSVEPELRYSHGFERSVPDHTPYLSVNTALHDIGLTNGFCVNFRPQLYYLRIDESDGFYATLTTTLSSRNIPLSISSILNTPIKTNIAGSSDFLWNVSLEYSFDLVD